MVILEKIKLTVKQKKFADAYIKSGNATQSYIDAGYKASNRKVAEANSNKLLGNHKVKAYLLEVNKTIQTASIADMVEVKEFWTNTMRSKYKDDKDRLKASEFIAKTNGAFIDKIEHSGEIDLREKTKIIDSYLSDDDIDDV